MHIQFKSSSAFLEDGLRFFINPLNNKNQESLYDMYLLSIFDAS